MDSHLYDPISMAEGTHMFHSSDGLLNLAIQRRLCELFGFDHRKMADVYPGPKLYPWISPKTGTTPRPPTDNTFCISVVPNSIRYLLLFTKTMDKKICVAISDSNDIYIIPFTTDSVFYENSLFEFFLTSEGRLAIMTDCYWYCGKRLKNHFIKDREIMCCFACLLFAYSKDFDKSPFTFTCVNWEPFAGLDTTQKCPNLSFLVAPDTSHSLKYIHR